MRCSQILLFVLLSSVVHGIRLTKNNRTLFLLNDHGTRKNPLLVCPSVIPLNGVHNCSDLAYWQAAHLGEATFLNGCVEDCIDSQNFNYSSLKSPKHFVCIYGSPHLERILSKMRHQNITYFLCGFASGFGGKAFGYYSYESQHYTFPMRKFSKKEIEGDPVAMSVITDFYYFINNFTEPEPLCKRFRLTE